MPAIAIPAPLSRPPEASTCLRATKPVITATIPSTKKQHAGSAMIPSTSETIASGAVCAGAPYPGPAP
jgi:hypothetical protein